jgi:hypothetical protein
LESAVAFKSALIWVRTLVITEESVFGRIIAFSKNKTKLIKIGRK